MKYIIDIDMLENFLIDRQEQGYEDAHLLMSIRHAISAMKTRTGMKQFPFVVGEAVETTPTFKEVPKETTPQRFEEFWKEYPKRQGIKAGKQLACKAWKKLLTRYTEQALLEIILASLSWQKKTDTWKDDNGKYVPMAATYLNQERFLDEQPEEEDEDYVVNCYGMKVKK